MADFKDDYYAEVDNAFDDLRGNPFNDRLTSPTPQEPDVPLNPSGWVENADSETGEAKVIIDADGLTVLDGKIFIRDTGGSSVLSSGGFDGSWTDFIETGVYNSHFQFGTFDEITAITEVSGGEGADNYQDSISADIPYWVVAFLGSDVVLRRVADAEAIGGSALLVRGGDGEQVELYQDIPVVSGQEWDVLFYWKYLANANNNFNLSIHTFWMNENHETISSAVGSGLGYSVDQLTYSSEVVESISTAVPTNARYLRLVALFTFTQADTSLEQSRVYVNGVRIVPRINYGKQEFPNGVADLDADSVLTDTFRGSAIQPSIDANQNNWNPSGFDAATVIGVTGLTAARTITGLVAASTGRIIHIINQSGQSLILAHESASSTDVNRFACPGAANLTIRTAGGVSLVYTINRWRVLSP